MAAGKTGAPGIKDAGLRPAVNRRPEKTSPPAIDTTDREKFNFEMERAPPARSVGVLPIQRFGRACEEVAKFREEVPLALHLLPDELVIHFLKPPNSGFQLNF